MPAAIEAWPDNRFTAGLPEPRGIPDYVIDDSGQGRFSVFYRQVDRSARQDWLEGLEGLGFERRVSASEPESENEPLGGEDRSLSVSWSGDTLGISIILKEG